MYAAIRRATVQPGAVEEVARRVQEGFVPILSQVPGFVALYLVRTGDTMVTTVGLFTDQAGADESNRRAATWVPQQLGPLMAGPLEPAAGAVLVQHPQYVVRSC